MKVLADNKRARFDYEILETIEAGIVLKGFETKAAKAGKINLAGSYARVKGNEVWLINANIQPNQTKCLKILAGRCPYTLWPEGIGKLGL